MVKKARQQALINSPVDVACLIHGSAYGWEYVERLYNMVSRHVHKKINFHVFTEKDRAVPAHMIKHELVDWPGVSGPRKSWWYKMQMFDSTHFRGRWLYLDLDIVITDSMDWVWQLDPNYFWTLRDFRHIWRTSWDGMNSSVMFWDTQKFDWIWKEFQRNSVDVMMRQYPGDQDYLNAVLSPEEKRFLDPGVAKSYRWQIKDGGLDAKTRYYRRPDAGSIIEPGTCMIIFHGQPKPHEISCPIIARHWA